MDPAKSGVQSLQLCKYSNRVPLKSILDREDNGWGLAGQTIVIGGWVRSFTEVKEPKLRDECNEDENLNNVPCFELLLRVMNPFRKGKVYAQEKIADQSAVVLHVSDGSCVKTLPVVVESSVASPGKVMFVGTSILTEGILRISSEEANHVVELKVLNIHHIGAVDAETYPLSKKPVSLSALRDVPHFRTRTKLVASIMRVRSAMAFAVHTFLQDNKFFCIQSPILNVTNSEDYVEKITVTLHRKKDIIDPEITKMKEDLKISRQAIKEKERCIEEHKRRESSGTTLDLAMQDLAKARELESKLKNEIQPKTFDRGTSSSQTHLTVSNRLHLESYACSLGNVYSFGPVRQIHKQLSSTEVVETCILELEIAFSQMEDAINCGCDLLKFICKKILDNCHEEIQFLSKRTRRTIIDCLQLVATEFEKVQYCEAINRLKQVNDEKFKCGVENGVALTEEHVKYLAEKSYRKPIIIYDFPKQVKPFHARLNDDGRTVAAFDIIIPKVGTLIRGMQNEERLNVLDERIKEFKLARREYEWYMDLRKHGTIKTSGLCLAFDFLVLYATGMDDVQDVLPFPSGHATMNK